MSKNNPFTLGDESYDLNTTYQPPDLDSTVDAVVPAIPEGPIGAVRPVAPADAPAAPAAAPVLQFTESTLASSNVTGTIGRPAGPPASSAPSSAPPPPSSAPGLPGDPEDPSKFPLWNVRRYRPYFDVDTKDVLWRVTSSFFGPFKPDFMAATMERPDLYGPFWVATTLIFVTAVAGNYADYIAWSAAEAAAASAPAAPPSPDPSSGGSSGGSGSGGDALADRQWYTDYAKMSFSALLYYGYVFVFGLALFFALRWFRSEIRLANVWCIYGYSLTIFIPSAFLCIVPLGWVRWLVVMFATALSGLFIVANLKTTIYEVAPARATLLLAILAGCHTAIGLALRLYFFHFRQFAMPA